MRINRSVLHIPHRLQVPERSMRLVLVHNVSRLGYHQAAKTVSSSISSPLSSRGVPYPKVNSTIVVELQGIIDICSPFWVKVTAPGMREYTSFRRVGGRTAEASPVSSSVTRRPPGTPRSTEERFNGVPPTVIPSNSVDHR